MKKISIWTIILNGICAFFMILFLFSKKELFSEEENRYLETFHWNSINTYINDHFPFRTEFIRFKNKFQTGIGKTYLNKIYIGKEGYLLPDFTETDKKEYIIHSINDFQEKNKNVDVMIIPDSILINEGKLAFHKPITEEKEIEDLYSKLKTNNISVISLMRKYQSENYQLYYKTDHHWNMVGAYIAYQQYQKSKGKDYYQLNQFQKKVISNDFLGTSYYQVLGIGKPEKMVLYTKDNDLSVNYVYEKKKTTSLFENKYLKTKDKYSYFLDNNHALIQIENQSIKNNNKLLIIKNSYANSMVPYLVNHYHEVDLIDLRYFQGSVSDYCNTNKIDNILILYNLNNLYQDLSIIKLK